jgi:hypothetical protein
VHPEQGHIWQIYLPESWIDPRVELRPSQIHGHGSFARDRIRACEVATIWGSELFKAVNRELYALDHVRIG